MSVTLHAAIVDAAPAVWAASLEPASSSRSEAYGLDGPELGTLLAALPVDGFAAPVIPTNATAWLPVYEGTVVGPPAVGSSPRADARRASLVPRTIAIASLTPAQAVALFGEALDRTVLANEIRIAPEVAALGRALRFAFELVAVKHVLPGLVVEGDNTPRARMATGVGRRRTSRVRRDCGDHSAGRRSHYRRANHLGTAV